MCVVRRSLRWGSVAGLLLLGGHARAAEPTKLECVRANEDGQDLRRRAKLRDAMQQFASCSAESCPEVVREDCARQLEESRRAMPTLVFVARDNAGRPVPRFTAKMDGAVLTRLTAGEPIEVDPGEHAFEFLADGYAPAAKKLEVLEGMKHGELVIFESSPSSAPEAPNALAPDGSSRRTVAYAIGGAGLVGVGIGAVFGILAGTTYASAKDKCPAPAACPRDDAIDQRNTARNQATISTVAFSISAAALAVGLVLWLTAPPSRRAEATNDAWGMRFGALQ